MSKKVLEIDISSSADKTDDEDAIKIELKSKETVKFDFSKLFFSSKYFHEKHPEVKECIEREISEMISKYGLKDEVIKEFVEIVSESKINIPVEHYRDIYALSEYFCIGKLTNLLDKMMDELFLNDLDFSIQILQDKNDIEKELCRKIEKFLSTQVNECMKNEKFKELPNPTIYRIIELAIKNDRKTVDINKLFDFIVESAKNRFVLFKFVELDRLSKDKRDEFIKFIDEQEESMKEIYLEYIPFNFLFIKEMKQEYEKLTKLYQQAQEELEQMKDTTQTEEETIETEEKSTQTEKESSPKTITVGGYDEYKQLVEKPNKNYKGAHYIHPPQKSSIDPSSLMSFSTYCLHSVEVTKSGKMLGIGYNGDGQIIGSLPKTEITEFREFTIKDKNGLQLDPISAVCCFYGTLYLLSSGTKKHLVLCDSSINGGQPVFLEIGDEQPVSLFGGCSHSAAINNKGEVIFINRHAVKKSPESVIKSVSLPDREKAVCVACCEDSVVALSSNGRLFSSVVQKEKCVLNFQAVPELSDKEIVCVSGTKDHFLAVSKDGHVFGRGSNLQSQLGLRQQASNVSSFTEISSLNGNKIKSAYAGYNHSLFVTNDGKIFACGYNGYSCLLLSSDLHEKLYSPTETTITESAEFCIAGYCLSVAFIGGDPPPNTPNRLIEKFE